MDPITPGKKRLKRPRVVTLALASVLAVFVIYLTQPHQPACRGRSLSVWLADLDLGRAGSHEKAERAMREIGTNAFPLLIRMLQKEDSVWKLALLNFNGRQTVIHVPITPASRMRHRAVLGFAALAGEAKASVPLLIQLLESDVSPRVRSSVASALGAIGPEARPAVPALSKAAHDANPEVKQSALLALTNIQMMDDVRMQRF